MWKSIMKRFDSSESYVSLALGLAVVLVIGMLIFNALSKKGTGGVATNTAPTASTNATLESTNKHTIKSGDTLWSIAEQYYKSGYNWVDIKKANPTIPESNELVVGQEVTIPAITPIVSQGQISSASTDVPAQTPSPQRTYTVVRGDTLWAIAEREYKNPYKWVEIARANNLANPGLIHAGNVFVLP